MLKQRSREIASLVLAVAAVAFGMLLVGGTSLSPGISAAPDSGEPVRVAAGQATMGLPSLADLAAAVSPAVVSIQASSIEERPQRRDNPLEFFFGPRQRPGQPQERRDSAGSGFLISSDGLIVTNHHVIEGADGLNVVLDGGDRRQYPARVIGDDPATDLALIKIEPDEPLTYLELGNSQGLRVGDWIMVIGSPLQLSNSVSVGVVSAKGRSINITPDNSLENFIQTDAAINFGNSGGPLVNLNGQVVGIATAINAVAENIGFAVPVETLQQILPQLRDTGVVRRGYLGINIRDLDYELAQSFGLDSTDGALVAEVVKGGPSEEAGLQPSDIVLRVDDVKVRNNRELIDYIAGRPPRSEVKVQILREGKRQTRTVRLGERPGTEVAEVEEEPEEQETGSGSIEWLGLEYRELNEELRSAHNVPEDVDGVWVSSVAPDSPLYDRNVRPGDVIADVSGQRISSGSDLEEALEGARSGSFLRLYLFRIDPRGGNAVPFFTAIRVP